MINQLTWQCQRISSHGANFQRHNQSERSATVCSSEHVQSTVEGSGPSGVAGPHRALGLGRAIRAAALPPLAIPADPDLPHRDLRFTDLKLEYRRRPALLHTVPLTHRSQHNAASFMRPLAVTSQLKCPVASCGSQVDDAVSDLSRLFGLLKEQSFACFGWGSLVFSSFERR